MKIRYRGERELNGGASYHIIGGENCFIVGFSGMNEYCADRVKKEIAELVHRHFAETQVKPGGIRTFRTAYSEEEPSIMPEIERHGDRACLKFSDGSKMAIDPSGMVLVYPPHSCAPFKSRNDTNTYKAEKFRDSHDEETLRAALERWGLKAS